YIFIEEEYFTLNVTGLAQDEEGNYVLNKGRSRDFTINVDRHYNNGSAAVVEPVSKDIDVNVEATNMEFYDSSKKQVYILKANTTYTLKHIATSTDIIKFSTWIPTSTDPIECTQDITVTTTTGENELLGYSLSLSGDIAIHYYLALAEDISSDSNTHMVFTMPNGTSSTVYVKDAVKTKANGMDCYVFTHKVSAKNMTSVVSSTLYDGENNVVEESEYSVEKYCDYIFAHPDSFSAKQTDIAKAMLTYGYYAQRYFGYNTDKLPKTISPLQDVDFTPYAYQNVDSNPDLEFIGARLVLTSKPGLKLYFKGNADLLLNGSVASTTQEGAYTVITISDIDDMSTMYMVMADSYNLTYGMFSFANQAMKGTNTDLKNLMKAMYAYNSYFK
ncbi:MAG: hypothetical protein KBT48_00740, partial [Firmicutes bacterium]|nr:hypothetical protein [Bacillota bacterium]